MAVLGSALLAYIVSPATKISHAFSGSFQKLRGYMN
jgi:hypothetical protein